MKYTSAEPTFATEILNQMSGLVYLNELEKPGDMYSLRNIWMNKRGLEFFDKTQEEITALGYRFIEDVIHPDDMEIIPTSIRVVYNFVEESIFVSLNRLKRPGTDLYDWYYLQGRVVDVFEDGSPRQLLTVGMNIAETMHTENQLVAAMKEINRLRNELKIAGFTNREKEILQLIVAGKTDKEIAQKLFISFATARKHHANILRKSGVRNSTGLAKLLSE